MDEIKEEIVKRWLIKAENDLKIAKTALSFQPDVTDAICFHAQQCVEKSLKAFLVYKSEQIERTHYLPRLVELCAQLEPSFSELYSIAVALTEYSTSTRYPDDWREIPLSEAEQAVRSADTALDFVKTLLKASNKP